MNCQQAIGVNLDIFLQGEVESAEFHGEKIINNFHNLLRETQLTPYLPVKKSLSCNSRSADSSFGYKYLGKFK